MMLPGAAPAVGRRDPSRRCARCADVRRVYLALLGTGGAGVYALYRRTGMARRARWLARGRRYELTPLKQQFEGVRERRRL